MNKNVCGYIYKQTFLCYKQFWLIDEHINWLNLLGYLKFIKEINDFCIGEYKKYRGKYKNKLDLVINYGEYRYMFRFQISFILNSFLFSFSTHSQIMNFTHHWVFNMNVCWIISYILSQEFTQSLLQMDIVKLADV